MTGLLLNCDEAVRFIEQIQDPVTKNLVKMAFVHLVKRVHLGEARSAEDRPRHAVPRELSQGFLR